MLIIIRDMLRKLGATSIAVEQKATSFTLKHELNEIIANLQNNVSASVIISPHFFSSSANKSIFIPVMFFFAMCSSQR